MGMIRKAISANTFGLVDFRSDKERIARSTRKGHKATVRTNELLAEQNALLRAQSSTVKAGQPSKYLDLLVAGYSPKDARRLAKD